MKRITSGLYSRIFSVLFLYLLSPVVAFSAQWYTLTDSTYINRFETDSLNTDFFEWSADDWANITFTQEDSALTITNFGRKHANINLTFTSVLDISKQPVAYIEAKCTKDVNMHLRLIDSNDKTTWGQFQVEFKGDNQYHAYAVPFNGSRADLSKLKQINFTRAGQETVDCDVTFRYLALGIRERFVLNIPEVSGGTVLVQPDQVGYEPGDTVTLAAQPNSSYRFDGWSGDVKDTSKTVEVILNSDLEIIPNFSIPGTFSRYFVSQSENASDSNPGTKEEPFRSIQKAASVAETGDTVFVREGIYRETVTPKNSGTAYRPIVYLPYNSEDVTISGTEIIEGWQLHEGNIYKAPMSKDFFVSEVNNTDQVFVDEQMMNLARWPNMGLQISFPNKAQTEKFISKTRSGNVTTGVMQDNEIPQDVDLSGAEIFFQPNFNAWSWAFTGKVKNVDGNKFTFESFSNSGKDFEQDVYHENSRYFLFNKYELLDTAAEWFHDKNEEQLYLWFPDGDAPGDHVVEAKKRDYGFNLSKKSHIIIKGFKIFGCNITTDDVSGGDGKGYTASGEIRYPWRNGSVAESHHITIDGIECLYPSHSTDMSGHFFFQYGSHSGIVLSGNDHVIQNSIIRYSFANAISILGNRHKIINNLIEDINYSGCEYAAIGQSGAFAWDCEMAYNTIRRTGRSGIRLGFRNSDPHNLVARVHHNEISDFMLQDWDGGGIYHAGDGGFTRMDHNIIHDGEGFIVSGIYPDWAKNYIYHHNIIYNVWADFQFTDSHEREGINNFVIYNNTTVCTNNDEFGFGPFNFGIRGEKKGIVMKNNIGWVFAPPEAKNYRYWSDPNSFDDITKSHNLYNQNPLFVDFPINFQLKNESPAIDAGSPMEAVTFDGVTIPPFNDSIAGEAMDIGALEHGIVPFKAGSTLDTVKSGSVIEIYVAGNTGNENLGLYINDNPVKIFQNVEGDYDSKNFEKYTYTLQSSVTSDMVKLWLTNYDEINNAGLWIDKIVIDGKEYQTEDAVVSCPAENPEFLGCNGFVHYKMKLKYSITVNAENGSVTMQPGGGSYLPGTKVVLLANADEGYEFTSWSGDITGIYSPYILTLNGNLKINANFTSITGSALLEQQKSIQIYPNPSAGNVTITGDVDKVSIFSATGQEIAVQQLENLDNLDFTYLNDGIYFFKLFKNKSYLGIRKVIINSVKK